MSRVHLVFMGRTGVRLLKVYTLMAVLGMTDAYDAQVYVCHENEEEATGKVKDYISSCRLLEGGRSSFFRTDMTLKPFPEESVSESLAEQAKEQKDALLLQALFTPEQAHLSPKYALDTSYAVSRMTWETLLMKESGALSEMKAGAASGEKVILLGSLCENICSAGITAISNTLYSIGAEKPSGVFCEQMETGSNSALFSHMLSSGKVTLQLNNVCLTAWPVDCRTVHGQESLLEMLAIIGLEELIGGRKGFFTMQATVGDDGIGSFGNYAEKLLLNGSGFLKSAWLTMSEVMPSLQMAAKAKQLPRQNWYKAHFYAWNNYDPQILETVAEDLAALSRTIRDTVDELILIRENVPGAISAAEQMTASFKEAEAKYDEFLELAGRCAYMNHEVRRSGISEDEYVHRYNMEDSEDEQTLKTLRSAEEKLSEQERAQEYLFDHLGGRMARALIQKKLMSCKAEEDYLRQQSEEAELRIERAAMHAKDDETISQVEIARTKLIRMQRHVALLHGKTEQAEKDLKKYDAAAKRMLPPGIAKEEHDTEDTAGQLLNKLHAYLYAKGKEALGYKKQMADSWPWAGKTPRECLKTLAAAEGDGSSVGAFMAWLFALCEETSVKNQKEAAQWITLLPDDTKSVFIPGEGGAQPLTEAALSQCIEALSRPDAVAFDALDARERLTRRLQRGDRSSYRAALAKALLMDTKPDGKLAVITVTRDDTPFAKAALQAVSREKANLVVSGQRLLGILDSELLLIPVTSASQEKKSAADQGITLTPYERRVLIERLKDVENEEIKAFVRSITKQETTGKEASIEEYGACIKAVLTAKSHTAFMDLMNETASIRGGKTNELLNRLNIAHSAAPVVEETIYTYAGECFAVSDSACYLETVAGEALQKVTEQMEKWERHSPNMSSFFVQELDKKRILSPINDSAANDKLNHLRSDALIRASQPPVPLTISYPEKRHEPYLDVLVSELIGTEHNEAIKHPFSDKLTLMTGALMAREDLMAQRTITIGETAYSFLLPISCEMASWMFEARKANTPYPIASLDVSPLGNDIQVSMSVASAKGQITLRRRYTTDDIVKLATDEIPTLTVFPAVNLPNWKAYYISQTGNTSLRVYDDGLWINDESHVIHTQTAPGWIALCRDDAILGIIENPMDAPAGQPMYDSSLALDFGHSCVTMSAKVGVSAQPFSLPVMWQSPLCSYLSNFTNETLALPQLGDTLPACVYTSCSGNHAFMDGVIVRDEQLTDLLGLENVEYALFSRADEKAAQARMILLEETLLLGMLSMRLQFAAHAKVYIAGEYTAEEINNAQARLTELCGIPCQISHVSDTQRAGFEALRRYCGVMSGCMLLDIGASKTTISVHSPMALNVPAWQFDLGIERNLSKDIPLLLEACGVSPDVEDTHGERQLAVQLLMGQHLNETLTDCFAQMQRGGNSRVYAHTVCTYAMAMTLGGYVLSQLYASRQANALPVQLPVILLGRASAAMLEQDPNLSYAYQQFTAICLQAQHPVRALSFIRPILSRPAAAGITLGERSETTAAEHLPTMPALHITARFLTTFYTCFPREAACLFPDMFDSVGNILPGTQGSIIETVQRFEDMDAADAFLHAVEALVLRAQ